MQREEIRAMPVFISMIKKEALHLMRDSRTMTVVLIMPLVLLLLFGFAISTEVNNVNVVAVVHRHDASLLKSYGQIHTSHSKASCHFVKLSLCCAKVRWMLL